MDKNKRLVQRQIRIRKNIRATSDRPRLSVFRSNKFIYAQIIDDSSGKTLIALSEKKLTDAKGTPVERAKLLGTTLAKNAVKEKIGAVVFDKGPYAYHGRIKALAEGAREGGLTF